MTAGYSVAGGAEGSVTQDADVLSLGALKVLWLGVYSRLVPHIATSPHHALPHSCK